MNKRILSLVLALVMVLGTFGTAFAAESTPTGNEKVDKLIDLGLVLGYGDGTYGLTQAITRAEVATMVVRALGLDEVATASAAFPSQFTDMNSSNVLWARGYVNVAAGQGIINGYPEGDFQPSGNVTYAEAAAMLVRAGGGLTDAEAATAVWPTTYLAKAAQLGILDGVDAIADFNAPAIRENLFEMVYNAIMNLQFGDYHIVKAIVLENYRVEKLAKDEVVVEVIKEIQRADWVAENRDVEGEQHNLTIPAKLGDVEALLGKVADFTLDKAGNVVAIKIDETYKVEVITEEDDITAKKFGDFTVEIGERYKDADERVFRTYFNNDAHSYEELLKELGRNPEVEYAKVTSKNGKVVYIDAFNFDDIAPVKEVNSDGSKVTVYNDLREGTTKNISIKATDDVLFVSEGNVSVGAREEIAQYDVIHEFDGGFIVRTDADVTGTYTKVTSNRDNDYFVVVEGEEYLIPADTAESKQAVYAFDEDEFYTLGKVRSAGSDLKEFEDEEVTILLDLTDKLQYIGSEIEMGEFVGIVTRVIGERVRVLRSDDKTYDYTGDLDTKVRGSETGHKGLQGITAGDLVYMAVDGDSIEVIEVLTLAAKSVKEGELKREIGLVGDANNYRLLSQTIFFLEDGDDSEVLTAKQVEDAAKDYDETTFRAYVINGSKASHRDLLGRRAPITEANEAYVVVFTNIELKSSTKTHVVQFDGWANSRKTEMDVIYENGTEETLEILDDVMTDAQKEALDSKDIIEIKVTDNDDKDIKVYKHLISSKSKDDVYAVDSYKGDRLTLKDANGDRVLVYTRDAKVFGNLSSADRVKVSPVIAKEGNYLDAILVVDKKWDATANRVDKYNVSDLGLLVAAYKDGSRVYVSIVEKVGTIYDAVVREYVGVQSLDLLAGLINEKVEITLLPGTQKVQKLELKVEGPEEPEVPGDDEVIVTVTARDFMGIATVYDITLEGAELTDVEEVLVNGVSVDFEIMEDGSAIVIAPAKVLDLDVDTVEVVLAK